ncbi:TPA: hypothetical protein ACX6RO_001745 [Photobacterium damselae]
MTNTQLRVEFADEMQNIDVSEEIYDYLESTYLHGININLVKEIALDSLTLGIQDPDEFATFFNERLLNIPIL